MRRSRPARAAIAPVHYAGVGCELDALLELARARGPATARRRSPGVLCLVPRAGAWKCRATRCLSFHETKNVIAGEGGALLLNRLDWVERAEVLHEKGTNRSRFFRGQVDKYTWVDVGSSSSQARSAQPSCGLSWSVRRS